MALTAQEAMLRLASITTVPQLTELLLSIEMEIPAGSIVLFSGVTTEIIPPDQSPIGSAAFARKLASENKGLNAIGDTTLGKFLITNWQAPNPNIALIDKLNELFQKDQARISAYLSGSRDASGNRSPNGLWDLLSARYVAKARGDVITLTGGARRDGVFALVELPALLSNPAITSIDGIPTSELRRLSLPAAFDLVTAASDLRAASLRLPVDASGRPLPADSTIPLDSRAFLADLPGVQSNGSLLDQAYRPLGEFIPAERLRQHSTTFQMAQMELAPQRAWRDQPLQLGERFTLSRLLSRVDDGLAVTGLALAALEAQRALASGDRYQAQQILNRWAFENAGALLAGRLATLALAPLVASGPLGLLLAGGLTLGASMLGSSYAEPAMKALIEGLARATDSTISTLQRLFGDAEGMVSPLLLDLDGNGVRTRGLSRGVFFDHDGNGLAESSGWVDSGDGLLVRDLNGDGRISSGAELFGNFTPLANGALAANGFEALRGLDANGDRLVDGRDPGWSSLRIWVDRNADAITDNGELIAPSQLGVVAIPTTYGQAQITDPEGNQHRQLGAYIRSDGSVRPLNDVWFSVNAAISRPVAPSALTTAIAALPDLRAMGSVPSLKQVMAATPGTALIGLLQQWCCASSAQRRALIEPILLAWTGVEQAVLPGCDADPGVYRRILALERLVGRPFRNVPMTSLPAPLALAELERGFAAISQEFDLLLSIQVDLPPLLKRLQLISGSDGSSRLDAGLALAELARQQGSAPDGGLLVRIARGLERLGDSGLAIEKALIAATGSQQDSLSLMLRAAVASGGLPQTGGSQADALQGGGGNDWLEGQDGNDQLIGGAGRDVLVGGRGNDTLQGGSESDLYLIAYGDGDDRISDADGTPGNLDEVRLVNLRSSAVRVERIGPDLVLQASYGPRLTVLNHFGADWARIEKVSFIDGVAWSAEELKQRAVIGGATAGNDLLGGYSDMVCRIAALAGDDTLIGGDLGDLLDGGSGNDLISGGPGPDTLIGGGGNDTLEGGNGSDLYRLRRGSPLTQIRDLDAVADARDEVLLEDRLPTDVLGVERLGDTLTLRLSGGEELRVLAHFSNPILRIERVRFSGGSLWEEAAINERLVIGGATAGNDLLGGYEGIVNRIAAMAGDDTLIGGNLADSLDGGPGNDSLIGGDGNDTLIGGSGGDTLSGGGGSDLYLIQGSEGSTLIRDFDPTPDKRDEVRFQSLDSTAVTSVERRGNDVTLRFGAAGQLTVPHQFTSSAYGVDGFRFADGQLWGSGDLLARAQIVG